MRRSTQRFILALVVLSIGAGVAAALIFVNIPDRNEAILNIALGFILGWGAAAVNYYFGSSDGSEHKTELMQRGASGKPGDPVHVEAEER